MQKRTLRFSINNTFINGLADAVVKALSTGPLVTAYALALGAGNIALGFLQAVFPISNLVHLPVAYFIEKGANLKKIAVWSSFLARPFWLLAALAVFWRGETIGLWLFVISYFMAFLIGSATGGAFWPWIKELVHPRLMNPFFAKRIKYILLTRIIITSTASGLIWCVQKYAPSFEVYVYSLFFVIAFLMGLYATWTLVQIEDKKIQPVIGKSFLEKIKISFSNSSFKTLLISLGLINFSMNFIAPFGIVFMLTDLKFAVSLTLGFTVCQQLIDTLTIDAWSRRTKKKGISRVLIESSCVYIGAVLFFILLSTHWIENFSVIFFVLLISYLLIGVANAGLNLGINDAAVSYVPKKMSAVYISINNTCRFFCAAAGPIVAGILIDVFKMAEKKVDINAWMVFFCCAIFFFVLSNFFIVRLNKISK